MGAAPTAREANRSGARRLAAAGVSSPAFDAGLLLRTAAGWSAADLAARPEERLSPAASARFDRLIGARAARRPLQHLTGSVEFFGVPLAVGPEALVPRPDTETLVEAVLARLASKSAAPLRIADVGCGSGAVALALASRLPGSRLFALDCSAPALGLAARNVRDTGFGGRVRIARCDLLRGIRSGVFDAVAANLPYVPDAEISRLPPEVRDHEPRLALAGGFDGLEPLRRFAPEAARALRPEGELFVEIGAGQRPAAQAILEAAGFGPVTAFSDLAGIPRVLAAPRAPEPSGAPNSEPPPSQRIYRDLRPRPGKTPAASSPAGLIAAQRGKV